MPYVQIRTTERLSKDQIHLLKREIGPTITTIPGKTQERLMLEIVPECILYMAGTDAPAAYVSVLVNNEQKSEDLKNYSRLVMHALNTIARIPNERIYITHQTLPQWHSSKNI